MSFTQKENCIHVYIRRIPFETDGKIYPLARKTEIESCTNQGVAKQKFYAWRLLEYGLLHSFGLRMEELDFSCQNGKWACSACAFSITHCADLVAVALSSNPVGVDIEREDFARFASGLHEKILTNGERTAYEKLSIEDKPRFLNALWTKKEAVFKIAGTGAFLPKSVETAGTFTLTRTVIAEEERFFLSVASAKEKELIFHADGVILREEEEKRI